MLPRRHMHALLSLSLLGQVLSQNTQFTIYSSDPILHYTAGNWSGPSVEHIEPGNPSVTVRSTTSCRKNCSVTLTFNGTQIGIYGGIYQVDGDNSKDNKDLKLTFSIDGNPTHIHPAPRNTSVEALYVSEMLQHDTPHQLEIDVHDVHEFSSNRLSFALYHLVVTSHLPKATATTGSQEGIVGLIFGVLGFLCAIALCLWVFRGKIRSFISAPKHEGGDTCRYERKQLPMKLEGDKSYEQSLFSFPKRRHYFHKYSYSSSSVASPSIGEFAKTHPSTYSSGASTTSFSPRNDRKGHFSHSGGSPSMQSFHTASPATGSSLWNSTNSFIRSPLRRGDTITSSGSMPSNKETPTDPPTTPTPRILESGQALDPIIETPPSARLRPQSSSFRLNNCICSSCLSPDGERSSQHEFV